VEQRIDRNLPRLRFFNRALGPDHDDDLPKLLYYLAHGDPKAKVGGSMSAQPPTSASEPGIAIIESAALGATLPTAVMRYEDWPETDGCGYCHDFRTRAIGFLGGCT
jgi:hypothetical protein